MVPGVLLLRFRPGALDTAVLSETFTALFYAPHRSEGKGAILQGGPSGGLYGGPNGQRGYEAIVREQLFADR